MRHTDGMSILQWLGLERGAAAAPVDSVSAVEKALAGMEPGRARYLSCFAYILSRVARADSDVAEAERRLMERIVSDRGGLPIDQAALVMQIATREGLRHGGP